MRYSTPEGRAWIRKEANENNFHGLVETFDGIEANNMPIYRRMQLILAIAQNEFLAEYFEGPSLTLNTLFVQQVIKKDPFKLERALPFLLKFTDPSFLFKVLKSSPIFAKLTINTFISIMQDEIIREIMEGMGSLFYALNLLAFVKNDLNLQNHPALQQLNSETVASFLFFQRIRQNLTETRLKQLEGLRTFFGPAVEEEAN